MTVGLLKAVRGSMPAIKRFKCIGAWQEARVLTRRVYSASTECAFDQDSRLRDQIQGSAISATSKIAEGFDTRTDPDLISFLGFVRRSATEPQSQVYTDLDQSHISQEEFDALYAQAAKTKGLIGGFIRYLGGRPGKRRHTWDIGHQTSNKIDRRLLK